MGKKANGHGSSISTRTPTATRTTSATKVEVEHRPLPVKLTDAELLERGESMAAAELAIDALREKRALIGRGIKDEEKKRAELAAVIERGTEDRQVRCAWIEDYPHNVWNLVRQDTGETVDTRAMTAADRQGSLAIDVADRSAALDEAARSIVNFVEQRNGTIKLDGEPAQDSDPHAETKSLGDAPPARTNNRARKAKQLAAFPGVEPDAVDVVQVGEQRVEVPSPKRSRSDQAIAAGELTEPYALVLRDDRTGPALPKKRKTAIRKPKSAKQPAALSGKNLVAPKGPRLRVKRAPTDQHANP